MRPPIKGRSLNAASAQSPDPVSPAGYANQAYGPAPYAAGPVDGGATGGCANCGKTGLLFKLGLKSGGCEGCGKHGLFAKGGCGDGKCGGGPLKQWLCRPYPSDAPVLRHAEYPLGFPNHPYVRSPRDYFMWNDP